MDENIRQEMLNLLQHLDKVEVGKWFRLRSDDRNLIRDLIKELHALKEKG